MLEPNDSSGKETCSLSPRVSLRTFACTVLFWTMMRSIKLQASSKRKGSQLIEEKSFFQMMMKRTMTLKVKKMIIFLVKESNS